MKYIIVLILFISSINTCFSYQIDDLDWSWNKKNMCSTNIQKAFKLKWSPGNAHSWLKYADKFDIKEYEVWDIAVMDRYNIRLKSNKMWWIYWHIAVIAEIKNTKAWIYDGPNAYWFWIEMKYLNWVVSQKKIVEMWWKIPEEKKND